MPGGFSLIAPVFCHSPKMCVRLISESKLSIMAATSAIMHLINRFCMISIPFNFNFHFVADVFCLD